MSKPSKNLSILVFAWICHLGVLKVGLPQFGPETGLHLVVPVGVTAILLGLRVGLITLFISYFIQLLVIHYMNLPSPTPHGFLSVALIMGVGCLWAISANKPAAKSIDKKSAKKVKKLAAANKALQDELKTAKKSFYDAFKTLSQTASDTSEKLWKEAHIELDAKHQDILNALKDDVKAIQTHLEKFK